MFMAQCSAMSELISHAKFSRQRDKLICLYGFHSETRLWSTTVSTGRANAIVCSPSSVLFVTWQTEENSTGSVMLGSVHIWKVLLLTEMSWKWLFPLSPIFKRNRRIKFCVILKTCVTASSCLLFNHELFEMPDLDKDELFLQECC